MQSSYIARRLYSQFHAFFRTHQETYGTSLWMPSIRKYFTLPREDEETESDHRALVKYQARLLAQNAAGLVLVTGIAVMCAVLLLSSEKDKAWLAIKLALGTVFLSSLGYGIRYGATLYYNSDIVNHGSDGNDIPHHRNH